MRREKESRLWEDRGRQLDRMMKGEMDRNGSKDIGREGETDMYERERETKREKDVKSRRFGFMFVQYERSGTLLGGNYTLMEFNFPIRPMKLRFYQI